MLTKVAKNFTTFWRMPHISVNLMLHATATNDPFFALVVRDFYANVRRRHRKLPLIRAMEFGVALCRLPISFDEHFRAIEAAARRNYKKAAREGCTFRRIEFNDHLEAIREIRQSSEFRQGKKMPEAYLQEQVAPCLDPPSRNPIHDYPFFGVFIGDKLVAYASCMIAGELALLAHILGHADYLEQGAVPFLLIELIRYLQQTHPQVRYYVYGTYFGATESMQRFKWKFNFLPHRVFWELGEQASGAR